MAAIIKTMASILLIVLFEKSEAPFQDPKMPPVI
jgi:hypothetical protein